MKTYNKLTLKKSLGQHFLKDEVLCKQIVDQLTYTSKMNLVEIGPGGGAITKYLLQKEDINFNVIEIDDEKVAYLPQQFPALAGKIIHTDFLKAAKPFNGERFSIIGNFPYNISTQIMFQVYEWEQDIDQVVGMFQKEVSERIAAKSGSKVYGILSVLIQAFFTVEYLFDVPPSSFNPPPKVMSGVIKVTQTGNPYNIENKDRFRKIVKAAFGQRRKTLRNALKGFWPNELMQAPIFNNRAEQLTVQDFVDLYNLK
jgi:16S rRNA (adenine1518-N6/adenine1519-N6)-dimethyltransferase